MTNLLKKELRLAASPLSYLFVAFGVMALIPSYPILVGAFFICFGVFQSFQTSRENADVLYTALLPVRKADAVKGKFLFSVFIELCGFCVMAAATLVRMALLSELPPYLDNVLMNANFAYLGYALVIFALFQLVFVAGFFKTAFRFAGPFFAFLVAAFAVIGVGETLHHLPGLGWLNEPGFGSLLPQLCVLGGGAVIFVVVTVAAEKLAEARFEKVDL